MTHPQAHNTQTRTHTLWSAFVSVMAPAHDSCSNGQLVVHYTHAEEKRNSLSMGIIETVLENPVLFVVPFYINLQKWVEAISVSNLTSERRVD